MAGEAVNDLAESRLLSALGVEPPPLNVCRGCWNIFRDGERGNQPARYLWTDRRGYTIKLCVRCCAIWRENAIGDPVLEPARIVELVPPPGFEPGLDRF